MTNRNRYQIIAKILEVTRSPIKKTPARDASRLSPQLFASILSELLKRGYLSKTDDLYRITQGGIALLEAIERVEALL